MRPRPGAALAILLLALAGSAQAHGGHGAGGFTDGLWHPLGADQLLAALAVGLWSAAAWTRGRQWQGPLLFLGGLLAGALAGHAGWAPPALEPALAASLVLLGGLMVLPAATARRGGPALLLMVGLWHGLAHGSEAPVAAPFAGFLAGLLLATAAWHGAGLAAGRRMVACDARRLSRLCAAALAGTGVLMLAGA